MDKCLISLSSITSQFRGFLHWIVFDFFLLHDSENDLLCEIIDKPMLPSSKKFCTDNGTAEFVSLVVQIYLVGLAITNAFEKTASDC